MPSLISDKNTEYYYDDPRLGMTTVGRMCVRVVTYITYTTLLAATATALLSSLSWLFWLGVLGVLFLGERYMYRKEADRTIADLAGGGDRNLAHATSPRALALVERSYERSVFTKRNFFLECAAQLVRIPETRDALHRLDVVPEEFQQKLEEFIAQSGASKDSGTKGIEDVEMLVKAGFNESSARGGKFIGTSALLLGLFSVRDPYLERLFGAFGLTGQDVAKAFLASETRIRYGLLRRMPGTISGIFLGGRRKVRHRVVNRAWTSRPTPTLDAYGEDLTDLARNEAIGFLVGHKEEYARLVDTLARPTRPNALLIGDPGVGKETIVAHLAYALVKDLVPEPLFDKRLVSLDLSRVASGAAPDELQKRMRTLADEIVTAGNVILYIPEVHNLTQTSGTAYLSAADALIPVIMNDAFPVIGSTFPREHKQLIEPRTDFAGAFEPIEVQEISEDKAETVLTYESAVLENKYGVMISFGAIRAAVKIAKRYFRTRKLPTSASELLKEAVAESAKRKEKKVGPEIVTEIAEEKTNVPIHEAKGAEAAALLNLEEVIHERMIDQEEAVRAVSEALRQYRSGLSRKGGPIASFLFVGPTGVGKTELAKTLARVHFGSESAMVRFDMTEYQDKQSFFRFIGSPDGKVSGQLTDTILAKPYALILLDEFEKAFPDILNLFLQVLDDGRLTDNLGRTVDFTNTIIIATSNAHSDIINESLRNGQGMSQIAEYLKSKLTDIFRPELINRFSKVVIFRDLSVEHIRAIVGLQMKELGKTLGDERGVRLVVEDPALAELARLGFDPAFGARPLRRVIDERVRSLLAQKILKGEIPRGATVTLTFSSEFEIGVQ